VGEEEFIFKTTKVPIRDERGKIVGLCGFANDITERKRAEKTSRESEARFRAVVETAIDAIIIIDGNDKIIFWNRAAADIFGYSAGETIGKPLTLIMPERFREAHQKAITRVISSRKLHVTAKPVEMVGLRKDGREFPVEFSLAAWETGKERFFTAILRDITERKRAEELLRESEARYRLLFKKLADAVFITSFEGEILEANPAASEQTGYSHEELIGMNIMEDLADEEPAATYEKAKGRLARGETVYFEEKKHRKDGTIYYTGCAVTQIEYKGKPATLSVNRDITERVQAEEALHWERDLASALEEATAALTATLDFEEVLDLILEEVTRVVPNDATNIMLSEGDKARIARWRGYERFGVEKFVSKVVFRIPEVGNLKQMRESMEPVVISDTTTYPGWLDVPGQEWLRSYAAVPIIVRGEVIGFLNVDSATPGFFTQAHAEILRSFAHRAAAAIENARLYEKVRQELTQREQAREELRLSFIQLAETVSRAMESHDPYTAGHQRRVAELARAIGEEMGFDQERLLGLYITGLLHDIGKLSIPAEMLTYPGRPTEEEWGIICSHPRRGYEILREAKFPWPVADIVLQHHERLDGSGYPKGLKDDEILLEARILAVADVVEAMSSHRPYREALGNEKALAEIEKNKGHLYDVDVADACLRLFRERRFKFSKQQM
jgi:PAS domain S-box-containing protein/putative nucleotidyltransferase with HDIG domain